MERRGDEGEKGSGTDVHGENRGMNQQDLQDDVSLERVSTPTLVQTPPQDPDPYVSGVVPIRVGVLWIPVLKSRLLRPRHHRRPGPSPPSPPPLTLRVDPPG